MFSEKFGLYLPKFLFKGINGNLEVKKKPGVGREIFKIFNPFLTD
jgi:hypothetical protein